MQLRRPNQPTAEKAYMASQCMSDVTRVSRFVDRHLIKMHT
jgi:hypothetical protein